MACEHGLKRNECYVCSSPKRGWTTADREHWRGAFAHLWDNLAGAAVLESLCRIMAWCGPLLVTAASDSACPDSVDRGRDVV